MRSKIIIFCTIGIVAGGILLSLLTRSADEEFQLVPQKVAADVSAQSEIVDTEVGTGWSANENSTEAVREAANMALRGKAQKKPDFAIIFASSGSDMEGILQAAKQFLGEGTKIFGGTSDSRAVMTDKGFVKVAERGYELAEMEGRRGLAIMTVSSTDIVFGVGSAGLSEFSSPQEMSKSAVLSAIKNAGRAEDEPPRIILLSVTIGIEEEVLEGIEQILGTGVPILGGTAGGPAPAVFSKGQICEKGVCLAVIYTDLPTGWTFEGGFDVTDEHTGVVTKVEGQAIVEINNRPALDVYDEWLNGEIERLDKEIQEPDVIRDLLILHPVYRKYTSPSGQDYFLFSHPWPKDAQMQDKSVNTSTKIETGERIYLSHGTWETLINRIGNLPRNAKIHGGIRIDIKPIFGMGFICGGVMGVIPETEREKMAILVNYSSNNAPFIANFTWGEQGYFPGIGSKHGNLLTSFFVIGPADTKE